MRRFARNGARRNASARIEPTPSGPLLGVFRANSAPGRPATEGEVVSADRRLRTPWRVPAGVTGGAKPGELVRVELLSGRSTRFRPARVSERLGPFDGARSLNRIAILSLELPEEFSPAALAEAARAGPVEASGREDLRALPLVTIDGEDAKDFDDAVFAEPEGQGYRIIVAIADVAHYVPTGSALDLEAKERGNSVYLPGRVLPMLPPALSEGWCSLRPGTERGVVFAEISIDAEGRKRHHRFGRGLMQSAARLTYEEFERAAREPDGYRLPHGTLGNLRAAWQALARERARRGPLEIDLPERKVLLDGAGQVKAVIAEERWESHRLIEDFMILANVAAAEDMQARQLPGLYRVHARPSEEKLAALREFLRELGVRLPEGEPRSAAGLTRAIAPLAGSPSAAIAAERLLQSLPEAQYSAGNGGHFGLALWAYAHFTSPIRRYADLVVHRALVSTLDRGKAGAERDVSSALGVLAIHLGITERRAVQAERSVLSRAQAALQVSRIGCTEEARISGMTRALIFVRLAASGADGVVPVSSLSWDAWHYDRKTGSLSGARSGKPLVLGERVRVRLVAACPVSGRLVFNLLPGTGPAAAPGAAIPPVIARDGGRRLSR
ncbi:MAG: ribonuclease R family protein [Acetobacteraceae bacterium]